MTVTEPQETLTFTWTDKEGHRHVGEARYAGKRTLKYVSMGSKGGGRWGFVDEQGRLSSVMSQNYFEREN